MVEERGQKRWDIEFSGFRVFLRGTRALRADLSDYDFQQSDPVYLGKRPVDISHIGRAHTAGDAMIHIPDGGTTLDAPRAYGGSLKEPWDAVRAAFDPGRCNPTALPDLQRQSRLQQGPRHPPSAPLDG